MNNPEITMQILQDEYINCICEKPSFGWRTWWINMEFTTAGILVN